MGVRLFIKESLLSMYIVIDDAFLVGIDSYIKVEDDNLLLVHYIQPNSSNRAGCSQKRIWLVSFSNVFVMCLWKKLCGDFSRELDNFTLIVGLKLMLIPVAAMGKCKQANEFQLCHYDHPILIIHE